jgi:hypothetical protein
METELLKYRAKRTHNVVSRSHSGVIQLSNGQLIITIQREIARRKRIEKATLLKWSDAGENRILVEVSKA